MNDQTPQPSDFLSAHDVVMWLNKNYQIQFQVSGLEMTHEEARKHFKRREAMTIVQLMLVDAGERALGPKH